MKKSFVFLIIFLASLTMGSVNAVAGIMGYGGLLCQDSYYECVHIKPGDNWEKLWPDLQQRDFLMRLNRLNIPLIPGMQIAVPKNGNINLADYSPFAKRIGAPGRPQVVIDPKYLAWAAYDAEGNLVKWGPASLGGDYCADIKKPCRTTTGQFIVYEERGPACKSSIYPLAKPGAPMPYCMFFHGGIALHGSYTLPGFNDSHGCVRLFPTDAKWLSKDFVDPGTRVIVLPYAS